MPQAQSREEPGAVILAERGVLAVSGDDRAQFLQGLVSNDISKVTAARAVHAALLTPQGRYLHDFFVYAHADALLLECERARLADLAGRLRTYRLRSDVNVTDLSEAFAVAVAWGEGVAAAVGLAEADAGTACAFAGGIAVVDPRLPAAGVRLVLPKAGAETSLRAVGLTMRAPAAYAHHRIRLGLADGSRDLDVEKTLLLEGGFDVLNGIDWDKGCYLGQEVTARSKYRGLVKKRLVAVAVDGPLPVPGTPVLAAGEPVGEVRSGIEDVALAYVRLDALAAGDAAPLTAADARLRPLPPAAGPTGTVNVADD